MQSITNNINCNKVFQYHELFNEVSFNLKSGCNRKHIPVLYPNAKFKDYYARRIYVGFCNRNDHCNYKYIMYTYNSTFLCYNVFNN